MNTNKLMDMYNSTFQPALEEGVYNVKMLSHEYVAKDEKTASDLFASGCIHAQHT